MVNASWSLLRSTMLPRTAFSTSVTLSCPAAWARSAGASVTCRMNNCTAATSDQHQDDRVAGTMPEHERRTAGPHFHDWRVRRSRAECPPRHWRAGLRLGFVGLLEAFTVRRSLPTPWLPAIYPHAAPAATCGSAVIRRGSPGCARRRSGGGRAARRYPAQRAAGGASGAPAVTVRHPGQPAAAGARQRTGGTAGRDGPAARQVIGTVGTGCPATGARWAAGAATPARHPRRMPGGRSAGHRHGAKAGPAGRCWPPTVVEPSGARSSASGPDLAGPTAQRGQVACEPGLPAAAPAVSAAAEHLVREAWRSAAVAEHRLPAWACRPPPSYRPGPGPGGRCPSSGSCPACAPPRPAQARPPPRGPRVPATPSAAAASGSSRARGSTGKSVRRSRWIATGSGPARARAHR